MLYNKMIEWKLDGVVQDDTMGVVLKDDTMDVVL